MEINFPVPSFEIDSEEEGEKQGGLHLRQYVLYM